MRADKNKQQVEITKILSMALALWAIGWAARYSAILAGLIALVYILVVGAFQLEKNQGHGYRPRPPAGAFRRASILDPPAGRKGKPN